MSTSHPDVAPQESMLPPPIHIHFLIIGGGIAGLCCAISLRRVGHQVTVLEAEKSIDRMAVIHDSGCRLPPNLTKILYHWGLMEELLRISARSQGTIMIGDVSSNQVVGTHLWNEEMLEEARGDFLLSRLSDLFRLLYRTAIELGATILFDSKVIDLDPRAPSVTLESGKTINGDVLIGADGPAGLTRRYIDSNEDSPAQMTMYSMIIPKDLIMKDPELATFYEKGLFEIFVWFNQYSPAVAHAAGPDHFALHCYLSRESNEKTWSTIPDLADLDDFAQRAEPRIRKLIRLGQNPSRISCRKHVPLNEWVHPTGKFLILGDGAHQISYGNVQSAAMGVEDAAVLARLFSYLPGLDRIPFFLYEFQEIRKPRIREVVLSEEGHFAMMCLQPGEAQRYRDQMLEESITANRNAFTRVAEGDLERGLAREWELLLRVFAYDVDDVADDWWVQWGLLKERATKGVILEGPRVRIEKEQLQEVDLGRD